ncbi:unspecified product [Plasmodium ovale wallikeri]|uniref:Unspecified product n=1 Tax=Plasmodium ovale wallikeri TaxID=864142 RepID=A0A1A9AJ07_PLAOA|nr:unspecified product [Plasmodium ovale wallikeri]SBT56910.1 unspecified product [Plasmodium ovale wallikeri]
MAVEVTFIKPRGHRSRTKDCTNEYDDIEEEVKKEVNNFKNQKEDDADFDKKCQSLRDYLNDYNQNNEQCFVSSLSTYYTNLKNSIEEPLQRCPNPPKEQVELDPEEIKRMSQGQLSQQGSELENPEQKASELEKKTEAAAHCKVKPCNTENLVREGLQDGRAPRNEETAAGHSQEVGSLNQKLQLGDAQPGHKGHSSSAHDPVDATSVGETKLTDAPSDKVQTQLGTPLQGGIKGNSDPNSHSDADGLPKVPVLSTDSSGASNDAPGHLEPSTPLYISAEAPSGETDHITHTTEATVTGPSSTKTTGKESQDKEAASAASLSLDGMSSHSGQSLLSKSMTPTTQSETQPQLQANGEHLLSEGDLSRNVHTRDQSNQAEVDKTLAQLLPSTGLLHDRSLESPRQFVHTSHILNNSFVGHTLNNGGILHEGTDSGGKDLVADGKDSTALYPVFGEILIKTFIVIASVIFAIILLLILLVKYTPLGKVFSEKKKKKQKGIQEVLDDMMYSSTFPEEKQMYLSYGHQEHSGYEDVYGN